MHTQKLHTISFLMLGFGLALFGPMMAMAPRWMPGAAVYAALALLPLLYMHPEVIKPFLRQRVLWLAVAAVAYSFITAFWTPAPHQWRAAIDVSYLSLCTMIMAAGVGLIPDDKREMLIKIFSLSLLVGFGVMAEELITFHGLYRLFNGMAATDFVGENVMKRMVALFSITLWPVAAWLAHKRGSRLWGIVVIVGFTAFSLIATSRAASLGLLLGLAVLLVATLLPKLMRYALIATLVAGFTLAVPVASVVDRMPDSMKNIMFGSAQLRLLIWQYTAQHVKEAPVLGHGIDSSRGIKTEIGPEGAPFLVPGSNTVISQHPHNVFLQIWLDLGAVGVLLWGVLSVMLAYAIRKLPSLVQPYALGAAFCSVGLLATTYSILQAWWAATHIVAAVMLVVVGQSISRSADTNGASAGGIGKLFKS
jgi:O-antigen ligase